MSDDLWLGLPHEAAKPKKNQPEAPSREPMRAQIKGPRRNPSADQRRVRRQLTRSQKRGSSGGTIYRGLRVSLPRDLQAEIDRLLQPPMEEHEIDQQEQIGPLIVRWLETNGGNWDSRMKLGRHWTRSRQMAEGAAQQGGAGNVGIILTATFDPADEEEGYVYTTPEAHRSEQEVTLKPGARVTITNVELPNYYGAWKGLSLMRQPIQATASMRQVQRGRQSVGVTGKVKVYRGISLQGASARYAWGLDEGLVRSFGRAMKKGDHQAAAKIVLDLCEQSGDFVEGGGFGVWWSTDLNVARGYAGMHTRTSLACVVHAEVWSEDIERGGDGGDAGGFGWSYEKPVILRRGADVDVVAIEVRYNPDLKQMRDGEFVHIPVRRRVTAATTGTYWRAHSRERPFAVEDAMSTTWNGGVTSQGYSCFDNPWDLWIYLHVTINWERFDSYSRVLEFSGDRIGEGNDGEDLVAPDMRIVRWMNRDQFEQAVLAAPMPSTPKRGSQGRSGFSSWRQYAERIWAEDPNLSPVERRILQHVGLARTARAKQKAARGFKCYVPPGQQYLDIALRMENGTATAADILSIAEGDNGRVGDNWGLDDSEYGPNWEDQGAEDYAYVDISDSVRAELDAMRQMGNGAFYGGDLGVVLIGMTDAEYIDPAWDASIPQGSQIELIEVRYNAGWGWKRLPARGLRTRASTHTAVSIAIKEHR